MTDLLQPHILFYVLMVLSLAGLWRRRQAVPRRPLLWLTASFLLLSALSLPVAGYLAYRTLESPYPPMQQRPPDTEAIVVLSGYLKPPDPSRPHGELGEDTLYRCLRAAEVYREGPRCTVLVSGGRVDPGAPGPTLAAAMREFLIRLGVAAQDILLEDTSRTTYENAVNSCELLRRRGLGKAVLVTDANSLLRADLCFRRQGIFAVPCGCNYRAVGLGLSWTDFVPNPGAFAQLEPAVHEWLGLAWYWLKERI